jgi:hypothetical protein
MSEKWCSFKGGGWSSSSACRIPLKSIFSIYFSRLRTVQKWGCASIHLHEWDSNFILPSPERKFEQIGNKPFEEWVKETEVRGGKLPNFRHAYISWMNHLTPQRKEIGKDVCSPEPCQFCDHLFSSYKEKNTLALHWGCNVTIKGGTDSHWVKYIEEPTQLPQSSNKHSKGHGWINYSTSVSTH